MKGGNAPPPELRLMLATATANAGDLDAAASLAEAAGGVPSAGLAADGAGLANDAAKTFRTAAEAKAAGNAAYRHAPCHALAYQWQPSPPGAVASLLGLKGKQYKAKVQLAAMGTESPSLSLVMNILLETPPPYAVVLPMSTDAVSRIGQFQSIIRLAGYEPSNVCGFWGYP